MKTLTLTQPWATLVAIGAKRIETRSWSTSYRGWLAIHAAKGWTADDRDICTDVTPIREALAAVGITTFKHLPLGAVLAVVNLHKVGRICERQHFHRGVCVYVDGRQGTVGEPELTFGDFREGRFGWVLTNPHELVIPVPAKGRLGLWEWGPPAGALPEGVR